MYKRFDKYHVFRGGGGWVRKTAFNIARMKFPLLTLTFSSSDKFYTCSCLTVQLICQNDDGHDDDEDEDDDEHLFPLC